MLSRSLHSSNYEQHYQGMDCYRLCVQQCQDEQQATSEGMHAVCVCHSRFLTVPVAYAAVGTAAPWPPPRWWVPGRSPRSPARCPRVCCPRDSERSWCTEWAIFAPQHPWCPPASSVHGGCSSPVSPVAPDKFNKAKQNHFERSSLTGKSLPIPPIDGVLMHAVKSSSTQPNAAIFCQLASEKESTWRFFWVYMHEESKSKK